MKNESLIVLNMWRYSIHPSAFLEIGRGYFGSRRLDAPQNVVQRNPTNPNAAF